MAKTRIMWIENKSAGQGIAGPARIGRVIYSKSGKSLHYKGKTFASLKGAGFKSNYVDTRTKKEYWISGCHKDGKDALYNVDVMVDKDVLTEYWTKIRNKPENVSIRKFRARGKYDSAHT